MKLSKSNEVLNNNTENSSTQQYNYIIISSKKTDFLFLAFFLILLIFFSTLLYYDLYKSFKGEGEPIGTIIFKKRNALRKIKNQSVWEYLKNEYPIYNGDSIKTEEFSEAILKLKDGTEISINESSLIVINFLNNETTINFNYGNIEANTNKNIKVQAKDSIIELNSANAKLSQYKDQLKLDVKKGNASINTGSVNENIQENEVAILSKENKNINKEKNNITLLKPEDNSRIITNFNKTMVEFQYESQKKDNYEIWIALNPNFNPIIYKSPINKSKKILLNTGTYYWKVVPKNKIDVLVSYKKFTILKKEKPTLYTPLNKSVINSKYDTIEVNFSWSKLDLASSYELWIDTNKDFNNPQIINTLTNNLKIPLKLSQNNTFYWKVIPKSSIEEIVDTSEIFTFKISKLEKLKPAILQFPINEAFYQETLKRGIIFKWETEILNKQTLEIATDQNFNNLIIKQENILNNFYKLKENLKMGTYYWRVVNEDNIPSKTAKFEINNQFDFSIISPKENEIYFINKINFIPLRIDTHNNLTFKIYISNENNFRNIFYNNEFNTKTLSLDSHIFKHEGLYYWKLEALSNNNKIKEKTNKFFVYNYPEKTFILEPNTNKNINLNEVDSIVIKWKKSNFTDFYILEFYKNGEFVFRDKTKKTIYELKNLNKQGIGLFDVYIYSARIINQQEFKSEPEKIRFVFSYKIEKKPEFITPDKILID